MWPQYIIDRFARIPPNTTIENKYYGAYNEVLRELFSPPNFSVEPQYALTGVQTAGIPAMEFVVTFVVTVEDHPVLFVEIKPPCHIGSISTREAADAQMRSRFRDLALDTPVPRLHGISAMGQRLGFYMLDKATGDVTPPYNAPSASRVTDHTAPQAHWAHDVVTQAGYEKLTQVARDIRQMVTAL